MWVQTLATWSWRNNITFFYRKLHSSKMTLQFFTLDLGQYFHCLWSLEGLTFIFSYVLLGRNRFGGLKSYVYLKSFFAVTLRQHETRSWNPVPGTSASALLPSSGVDGEGGVYSSLPMSPHDRWAMGTALPSSQIWGWLPYTAVLTAPKCGS